MSSISLLGAGSRVPATVSYWGFSMRTERGGSLKHRHSPLFSHPPTPGVASQKHPNTRARRYSRLVGRRWALLSYPQLDTSPFVEQLPVHDSVNIGLADELKPPVKRADDGRDSCPFEDDKLVSGLRELG